MIGRAKNHADVAIIVDPEDYERVARELDEQGCALSLASRFRFAPQSVSAHG